MNVKFRKFLAIIICLVTSLPVLAQENATLIITTKSNGSVTYAMNERPKVTFSSTDVVLTTSAVVVNYPLNDFVTITFGEDNSSTSIEEEQLVKPETVISCTSDKLAITKASAGSQVAIYTIDGKLVSMGTVDENGFAEFDLATRGIYIVRVGSISFKIKN